MYFVFSVLRFAFCVLRFAFCVLSFVFCVLCFEVYDFCLVFLAYLGVELDGSLSHKLFSRGLEPDPVRMLGRQAFHGSFTHDVCWGLVMGLKLQSERERE